MVLVMKRERSKVRIYLSYPYSDDPDRRIDEVREIVRKLMKQRDGFVLFIPHFAFHAFNKDYGEETADEHCIELLAVSDMLCICLPYDKPLTRGMKRERDYAIEHNMPIVYLEDFLKDLQGVLKKKRELAKAISSKQ
jgi:hypothetical protein